VKKLIALALSLSSVALVSGAVAATPASAMVFCETAPVNHVCTSPYPEKTTFKATLDKPALLQVSLGEIVCSQSTVEGTLHQAASTGITLSSYIMQACGGVPTETINPGGWNTYWLEGTDNARISGHTQWKVSRFGINCVFYLPVEATTLIGGNPAKIEVSGVALLKADGGAFCGNTGKEAATYTVTSPGALYIAKE
jgi:hypothetical protein